MARATDVGASGALDWSFAHAASARPPMMVAKESLRNFTNAPGIAARVSADFVDYGSYTSGDGTRRAAAAAMELS